ncbi:hypothetical protein BCR34DRAFT_477689 [Clohesyomyces aquaticus]|uniref:G-patch domain-containing protein n=1 Tax=Clohesyomyces aquaticus TaxID=1231657 RepID=A0A1Y2A009_9PLEO|nr:hypothetical protein BCR34DRAFT_477689 [Clohesyomyces aquaticus]
MAFKRPRPSSPSVSQKRSRAPQGQTQHGGYVKCGTPMSMEQDGDDGAFVPVWKQTVTDDRGRRRLHGAFTGGFSAGYFNTVGSKEGWTPKTFVSSRSNRNKDQTNAPMQRAEDFMDEEDLAEAAAARQLETVGAFAGIGGADQPAAVHDGLFGLMITEDETMGVKLLQKMGWRRGQGIGPKVRRHARIEDGEGSGSTDAVPEQLFAPEDARVRVFAPPTSKRGGLGYRSDAPSLVQDVQPDAIRKVPLGLPSLEGISDALRPKKPKVRKSGIGTGILNDNGSDDEDPYELGPKITFNRTIAKEKKMKKPTSIKASKFAKAAAGQRHVFVPQRDATQTSSSIDRLCRDGSLPLKGFSLLTIADGLGARHKLPPPRIPEGWTSSKNPLGLAASRQPLQSIANATRASTLDAKGRASLLSEKALPGKSIFDYISKEDRDRLAALTGKNLPPGLGQQLPEDTKNQSFSQGNDLWGFVPALDKHVATAALAKGTTGWMPYGDDPKKRARYIGFLEIRAGLKDGLPERVPGITNVEWGQELREFAQAAHVFKPIQGLMASRFTSSTSHPQSHARGGPSHTPLLGVPEPKPEDPAETAAKLGMYGAMTRTVIPFHPARLLCKRFNVKPPPDVPFDSESAPRSSRTEEPVSKAAMNQMFHQAMIVGSSMSHPSSAEPHSAAFIPDRAAEQAPVDSETNEALLENRASDDVFRALFGDEDDD